MNLLFELPQRERTLLGEAKDSIQYCAPYDIDSDGNLCRDGWFVVTKSELIVFLKGAILHRFALQSCGEIKCEGMIDSGLFVITPGGEQTVLARFSMKHLSRFSYIARGARLLKEGNAHKVESLEAEKTCEKCGAAMPGTHVCPRCGGRRQSFKRFIQLSKPYALKLSLVSLLMLATSGLTLYQQHVQRLFIDDVLVPRSGTAAQVWQFGVTLFVIIALIIVFTILKQYLSVLLGSRISMDLRNQLFQKIQSLSLSYLNTRKPGDLMNRIVGDTAEVRQFMQDAFANMFSYLLTMVGCLTMMFVMNWKLTLLSIVFVPFVMVTSRLFHKKVHRMFRNQRRKSDKLNSQLQDVIQGIRVVKSFGKEKYEAEQFDRSATQYRDVELHNERFWAIFQPLLGLLMHMGLYCVIYFGGLDVLGGDMSIGQFTQFLNYAGFLYGPLGWITHLPRMLVRMQTGLSRIYDVLDETPDIADTGDAVDHAIQGDIVFDKVTFGYKNYEPVVDGISFHVKQGEMIGLVGESGAGKSTLINLIMRLYDVDEGRILVDGQDIRSIRVQSLHNQIGVVLQETFLFSGTILENIRFSKPDATYEEVIRAAKMANAHEFICKFPDGYDTYVGESGHNLSGGERQRIAIARAILNDPRILILDEATSSLDTESEFQIQKALERLTKGRTTFAIAHRLSTLRGADRLFVIDKHKIAECGTHEELMESSTIYKGLVQAQLEMHAVRAIDEQRPPA